MTDRTARRRLERAGYASLSPGWVPKPFAERAKAQVKAHKDEVERIAAEPPAPRGRPRKTAKTDAGADDET